MSAASDRIGHLTTSSVRVVCDALAPSCVDCPYAKSIVSVDASPEIDGLKIKIGLRCERMTMIGPACPDGGSPGGTYLKDLGIPRKLGEQQITKTFSLSHHELDTMHDITLLKSPTYAKHVKLAITERADEVAESLHIMNETLVFLCQGEVDHPIGWRNEATFESFNEAREGYISQHVMPYKRNSDVGTGICEPTPYMKEHFPKEMQRHFGVMTDYEHRNEKKKVIARIDEHEGVTFFGDDPPPQPTIVVPPPTQEDIYDDWGTFA